MNKPKILLLVPICCALLLAGHAQAQSAGQLLYAHGEATLGRLAVDRQQGGPGKDLVFTYPLEVTNRLDRPVTAALRSISPTAASSPCSRILSSKLTNTITPA